MKTAFTFVLFGILFLAVVRSVLKVTDRQSKIDIRIHTTYFIVSKKAAIISTIIFLFVLFITGWLVS